MLRPTLVSLCALLATPLLSAKEYPIGEPQACAGMEVGAVYLQPIEMDPPGMMQIGRASCRERVYVLV